MRKALLPILFFSWARIALGSLTPELEHELRVIKAVGPEGRGNIEASSSWKKLVAGKVDHIMPLLEGIINELDLGETILSTPSIAQGGIFFRSDARLWKLGKPQKQPSA
jgi:hypothetical protein